ncbi:MAG: hypothetical protein ACI37S_04725 [Candidatus Gastranaerophilaceae bacterium]
MGNDATLNGAGLKFHHKQDNKLADKYARESALEMTAKALIIDFSGHKGNGDNAYIENNGKKMDISDVAGWIDKLDKNGDGFISQEELKKGGGDELDILKLRADEETQKKVEADIRQQQLIGGFKTMHNALDSNSLTWKIAKPITLNNLDKTRLLSMLSKPECKDFYDKKIWGNNKKQYDKNEDAREHFKEILKDLDVSNSDLEKLGFPKDQIDYFTK